MRSDDISRCDDIFVWPDGSWLYRGDYSVTDSWRGDDFDILFGYN